MFSHLFFHPPRRRRLAAAAVLSAASLGSLGLPGCFSPAVREGFSECTMNIKAELAAERAYLHRLDLFSDCCSSPCDFKHGFKNGYVQAMLDGDDCCAPPVPPKCYWGCASDPCERTELLNCYYDGWAHGAMAAGQDGVSGMGIVPVRNICGGYGVPMGVPGQTAPYPPPGNPYYGTGGPNQPVDPRFRDSAGEGLGSSPRFDPESLLTPAVPAPAPVPLGVDDTLPAVPPLDGPVEDSVPGGDPATRDLLDSLIGPDTARRTPPARDAYRANPPRVAVRPSFGAGADYDADAPAIGAGGGGPVGVPVGVPAGPALLTAPPAAPAETAPAPVPAPAPAPTRDDA